MEDYDPYVAEATGSLWWPHSELPQEWHVRPRENVITYPEEELTLYEDNNQPPDIDFTLPEDTGPPSQNPPTMSTESSEGADPNDVWGPLDAQTVRFPVEFRPFVYLKSEEQLEEELLEWYGSGAKQWLYEEPCLIVVFTKWDRTHRALESQKLVAKFYPSEPSAYAQPYKEGLYHPWSPKASTWILEVLSKRTGRRIELCPIPQPLLVKGSFAQPPGLNFKSANLAKLFHPNSCPQVQGLSQSLMSWYLLTPKDILSLLARQIKYLSLLTAFNMKELLEAMQQLESLLRRHLAYQEPVKFNVQIPFGGPHRTTLKWIAWTIPSIDPTSLTTCSMYAGEQFHWNGWFEHYEITLDDLDLKDLGILPSESWRHAGGHCNIGQYYLGTYAVLY
jgi:hypothetical protein